LEFLTTVSSQGLWIAFGDRGSFVHLPPTVILAVWSISLNSGASPDTSHLYCPEEWALSFSSSTLQMNWLQCGEPSAMVTPLTGNQFVVGGVSGEYLQGKRRQHSVRKRQTGRQTEAAAWVRVLRKTETMKYWWANHAKKEIFFGFHFSFYSCSSRRIVSTFWPGCRFYYE